jgi:hypothetical protein
MNALLTETPVTRRGEIFKRGPRVINVGLEGFAADLERLGVPVTHVDWAPPAGCRSREGGAARRARRRARTGGQ